MATSSFQIETQEKLHWCWAAVAATVAHYFFPDKPPVSQCQIAQTVVSPVGTSCCADTTGVCDVSEDLMDALKAVNDLVGTPLKNLPKNTFLAFDNVKQQIDSKCPVCARIQWSDGSGGHFVMVSGYSVDQSGLQWVDIADPYYDDSTVPYDQFVSDYLGKGTWSETYLVGQP